MKKFKYKFSKLTKILICVGLLLPVVAFALNTYYVIAEGTRTAANPFIPVLRYVLMYFVSVLTFIILLSLLISSYYSVDDKYFKTSLGIIKSKYEIKKIDCIVIEKNVNKLGVYFKDQSFIVVAINEEWYDEFSDALLAVNPAIEFSIKSEDPPRPDDKKK